MKKGWDTVAGLLLICAFACCLFFALAAGARIYKSISSVMEEQYTARTAIGYVVSRIHQGDGRGAVELDSIDGRPALIISQETDGVRYLTYIYQYDGYIRELFCPASETMTADAGLPVIAASELTISLTGRLVHIRCVTGGGESESYVCLKSEAAE